MEYNGWTQTETYLLVEKLSSSTRQEEWAEVVQQFDKSDTLKLESYRLKAMRKYAASMKIPFESVEPEEVETSPHGLQGWAEMNAPAPRPRAAALQVAS